jgi:hypothetical protein
VSTVDDVLKSGLANLNLRTFCGPEDVRREQDVNRAVAQSAITTTPIRAFRPTDPPQLFRDDVTNRIRLFLSRKPDPVSLKIAPRMVDSRLHFDSGHEFDRAFDGRMDTYVAASEEQSLPQEVSIRLPRRTKVERVTLRWLSVEDLAEAFELRLRSRARVNCATNMTSNDLQRNAFDIGGADCIELCVNQFRGQQRLLLRDVQILIKRR